MDWNSAATFKANSLEAAVWFAPDNRVLCELISVALHDACYPELSNMCCCLPAERLESVTVYSTIQLHLPCCCSDLVSVFENEGWRCSPALLKRRAASWLRADTHYKLSEEQLKLFNTEHLQTWTRLPRNTRILESRLPNLVFSGKAAKPKRI